MDFSQFDSRKAAEAGRDLHMRHPGTGELLFDNGKPCIFVVKGAESAAAQESMARIHREKMEHEGEIDPSLWQRMLEMAIPLVVGFKNVEREEGKPAKAPDDVEYFLNMHIANFDPDQPSFVEQVLEFARKRRNFLGNASSG